MTVFVMKAGGDPEQMDEQEFRDRIFRNEILESDYYWHDGLSDWQPVSAYRRPTANREAMPPMPIAAPTTPTPVARKHVRRQNTPAGLGGACAFLALLAPLLHESLFFLISLPLLVAAFVLAIVSLVKGRVTGGIILLIALLPCLIGSCGVMMDRQKILNHEGPYSHSTR